MSSDGTSRFPASTASSPDFVRRMVGGVAMINLFVFGMVAFSLHQSLDEYEERAEMTAQNMSRMLAQDIGREFEKIDVALLSAADEIERQLAHGGIGRKTLNIFLARLQERVPEIISLRTTDAQGIVSHGRGVDPGARLNNSDREYFIRQRDNPRAGLVISNPVFARIDKRWVVPISRAIRLPDGSFGGVVYCNVEQEHLARVFSAIDIGRRGSVSLRDAQLRIFARYPVPKDADQVLGRKLDVPELHALIRSGRDAGTYISSHTVDGVKRKFAVRRVDALPLYVVVGRATDEYLAPWRAQAAKMLALGALFFLATLISSWLIYRSWRRQMSTMMELAREEEKFHTVADYTYDWEYWEGPKGEMLYMSPACERITGYSRHELLADPKLLSRIVHPDDRHLWMEHRHDTENENAAAVDFRILRKDGEIRWIAHACQSVFGREGRFMGRRISNRDITERKRADEALRTSEQRYRLAQAIGHVGNWEYNIQTARFWGSDEAKCIYGFDPAQYDFSIEEVERCIPERERVHQALVDLIEKGKPYNLEFEIHPRDSSGSRIIASIADVQRDEHGNPQLVMGVILDISKRKKAEEKIKTLNLELEQRVAARTADLEAANKELEAFSFSVSHDLRVPLHAIDGFSNILLDDYAGKLDDEGKRLLSVVRDNASRMEQLIDDILRFSRAGRLELSFSEIDMEQLAHAVYAELQPTVAADKLQLEIEHLPPVRGDSAMMRQVFVNLLSNAIKFSAIREVPRIQVGATVKDDETIYYVKDNGAGFDMQYAEKLFGVFQRLHGVTEFEGTGIGLAIVKRIITRHGGRVWAEGKVNEGATIYFALPGNPAGQG